MFDRVTIRATDRHASETVYGPVLGELGIVSTYASASLVEWHDFSLVEASDGRQVTEGLHVGFAAPSRAHVDAFWHAGRASGLPDAGAPGERPHYKPDYYGAFLLDPDGNSIEAVHHGSVRTDGGIDHLWLRTADLEAARTFYAFVASLAGLGIRDLGPEHVQVLGAGASFSVVPGRSTRGAHLALPAATNAAVDAFREALVGAGFRDGGPPGALSVDRPGSYGAFVLDPDGNRVELVNHNRR